MVEITKYGISLKRLTEDKIELVRNWRNDPKIAQFMEYREHITSDMQYKWFQKINNDRNYYFIVEYEGQEIGLVNIKDIDYNRKCGETGIFIYDDRYLNGDVSFRCALCNIDFVFENLNLDFIYGHIMNDNRRAIRYNKVLGFRIEPNQEGIDKQLYTLYRDQYLKSRESIIKLLK